MAHPTFYDDIHSASSGRNWIDLIWTSGASGAVPTTLTTFAGVTSVVHGSTGVYTITFDSSWNALLLYSYYIKQASYSKNGACDIRVTGNAIATPGTKTVTLLVVDGDGDAVEPTTGDILSMTFTVQTENVNAGG